MENRLDKSDYLEPCCPFDTSFYKDELPKAKPRRRIPVNEMIAQIDRLNARGDKIGVGRVLEEYAKTAQELEDIRGELTVQNELIGHYRMTNCSEKGFSAIERTLALLPLADMAGTVSAGTILLNAATALRAFGQSERALQLYTECSRTYAAHLPHDDTRFAGLYNNMASAYSDVGQTGHAEAFYQKALSILNKHPKDPVCRLDAAVSYLNLAQFYFGLDGEDKRIDDCVNQAITIFEDTSLPHDGYYAHTAEKCAGGFAYLGYFMFAETLSKAAEDYYERA